MPEGHKYEHEKIQERLKAFDSRILSRREEVKHVDENQYQIT